MAVTALWRRRVREPGGAGRGRLAAALAGREGPPWAAQAGVEEAAAGVTWQPRSGWARRRDDGRTKSIGGIRCPVAAERVRVGLHREFWRGRCINRHMGS